MDDFKEISEITVPQKSKLDKAIKGYTIFLICLLTFGLVNTIFGILLTTFSYDVAVQIGNVNTLKLAIPFGIAESMH